jgi:DHA1 family bicyclomycin/chloramphenicol resistance-like MFS transporter
MSPTPGPLFNLALASISLIGPLAVHLFMPVIPAVKADLALSDAMAQFTFSIALFGMAFAPLVYGSLSDRYGRRPLLLSGLSIFLIGSLISAVADSVTVLVVGRLAQAIGAGCGVTLVRTIAADVYGPSRLVKVIAYVTMFYTLGPMISPMVGGFLSDVLGWRSVFAFALLLGSIVSAGAYLAIFESRPPNVIVRSAGDILRGYAVLLTQARFAGFVLQTGFCTGVFIAAATAAATLMKELLDRPATEFGFIS